MVLKSNLSKIAEQAPHFASVALLQTGVDVFNVSQQLCPVLTGELKASGGVDVISSLHVRVGYSAPHAPLQEFGTSIMASQPFLIPAFAQNEQTFAVRLRQAAENAQREVNK
jgi:HK97 gp10 family phage protein